MGSAHTVSIFLTLVICNILQGTDKAYGRNWITPYLSKEMGGQKIASRCNVLCLNISEGMVSFSKLVKHNLEMQEYCWKIRDEDMIVSEVYKRSPKRHLKTCNPTRKSLTKQTSPSCILTGKKEAPLPMAGNHWGGSHPLRRRELKGAEKGPLQKTSPAIHHGHWDLTVRNPYLDFFPLYWEILKRTGSTYTT